MSNPSLCQLCFTPLDGDLAVTDCTACSASYHADCWEENRGCGAYGCTAAPPPEPRTAMEIPNSHWGQETKPCPACDTLIAAAAVRCRKCGATFASAAPVNQRDFYLGKRTGKRQPAAQRMAIILFVLCVIPCCAPPGLLALAVWQPTHREDVKALPPLHRTLLRLGLVIGLIEMLAIVAMSIFSHYSSTSP